MSYFTNINSTSSAKKQKWSKWIDSDTADTACLDEGVEISEQTYKRRRQMYGALDAFCHFTWNGWDAFKTFGAFVINDKEDLKFYNGPSFSNEYNSPQFNNTTNLSGITFKTQQISFKIGVYWISIQDYRVFLNWLSPYVISILSFGFNARYCYQVKLASISDSIRYVIGKEGTEPMYYTEMTLTFDIQGEPCAREILSASLEKDPNSNIFALIPAYPGEISSDLDVPFKFSFTLGTSDDSTSTSTSITLSLKQGTTKLLTLFSIDLQNLYALTQELTFEYDSQSGLIYYKDGNVNQVLNKLNNINGQQIVKSMVVNKAMLPGRFTTGNWKTDLSTYKFELDNTNTEFAIKNGNDKPSIECYFRTNII